MAQELLTTFAAELGEVAIQPGTGGVFEVRVDGETIWSRATQKRFPDVRELKQLVRDRVAPGRDLGHGSQATVKRYQLPPASLPSMLSEPYGGGKQRSSHLR